MICDVFREYVEIRKELGIRSKIYYFKKTFLATIFTGVVVFIYFYFDVKFDYKSIAAALMSVNAIVAAFLIMSLTVLLTQKIQGNIPNKNVTYESFLVNNSEINAIFILISIIINIAYLLLSNITTNEQCYSGFMFVINCLSIFSTIFIINMAIKDLLLISKKTKSLSKGK